MNRVGLWIVWLLMVLLSTNALAQMSQENRSMLVETVTRQYLLSKPTNMPAHALPLVISLHGDGGNAAGMRNSLRIEDRSNNGAVFVYLKSAGNAFEYWSSAGRAHEGLFVQQLISTLHAELAIDTSRVYLVGFSGGATMANALGCRLGRNVIRGVGIHSGTLYPVNGDFGYTDNGGVTCDLPQAIFVWGRNDNVAGVTFAQGEAVRNNYLATQGCAASTQPFTPSPCVAYNGCAHRVNWCPIDGLGHSVWGSGGTAEASAAAAIWNFIQSDSSGTPTNYTLTYTAGPNGSITGITPQTVPHGGNGTAVTALPNAGYQFAQWSDGVMTATRIEQNVTANKAVTASFTASSALFNDGFEASSISPPTSSRWVMGYYVGYERDLQTANQIDFSNITHLMVGRVVPLNNGTIYKTFDIDTTNGPIWAQGAVDAAHAANRKAILMVGGAGTVEAWRSAATPANRATFVTNLLATMDQFNADGLDLDWEPIHTVDHANLLALAQALRAARPTMLLTMPVDWINTNTEWNPRPVGEAAFLQQIAPSLDRINVMTYEMAADYSGWNSWFSGPLHGHAPNTPSSASSSINYYLTAGVPAAKLGIGVGFYGNCFRGVTQPRVAVTSGNFIASDGAMSYRNILANYLPSMTQHYDSAAQAAWLGSAVQVGTQNCNFVSYENPQSVAAKMTYARNNQLGGVIVWTISQGYLPSAAVGLRDPLLKAIGENYLN